VGNQWPVTELGRVVRHRKDFIEIDDSEIYKRCRVQLHTKGIVLRDKIQGIDIQTKKQQVCRAGELLVAEIDAKVGGYGVVPDSLDGAIVSSHYFLFEIDESLLVRQFLDYFIRTSSFFEQVRAQGSTNYAAIRPSDVLNYKIPFPTIGEQQQLVALISAVETGIEEAKALRRQADAASERLCYSMLFDRSVDVTLKPMHELVKLRPLDVAVNPEESYQFAGVYSFGRGVFKGAIKAGSDFSYSNLTRLKAGNFVYPKLMAWEGALGVVPPECDGLVVSPEFPVFVVNESEVLPEVLDIYFRTPSVWPILSGTSTGTNVRRRRLNPPAFLEFKMPVPRMSVQQKIREVKNKLDALRPLQKETYIELNALIKSSLDKAFKGELSAIALARRN
jgi:type I restriction enzyme S subunit